MRKAVAKASIKWLTSFFVILLTYDTYAQCPDTQPIPQMYVEDSVSARRRTWFEKHQLIKYSHQIRKLDNKSISCDASDFLSFLDQQLSGGMDTLFIFIASYPESDPDIKIPSTDKHKLTVFFVPDYKGTPKDCYVFDPSRNYKIISHKWAQAWIDEYEPKRKTNNPSPKYGYDTKYITFTDTALIEFKQEMECQNASDIKIYFSSYRSSDKEFKHSSVAKHYYWNRLNLQFALIDADGNPIDLEKQNYRQRKSHTIRDNKLAPKMLDFNNGQLCPPNCPH